MVIRPTSLLKKGAESSLDDLRFPNMLDTDSKNTAASIGPMTGVHALTSSCSTPDLRITYDCPCFKKPDHFVRLHPSSTSEDAEIRGHWTPENHNEAFIFWVRDGMENPNVYLCDIGMLTVYQPHNSYEDTLALTKRIVFSNLGMRLLVFRPLATSPEGLELIERILRRDGNVREALERRKWLGYVSKETGMSAEKEMTHLDSKCPREGEAVRVLEWYH
ncbi:hypothetical protein Moror_5771 [Moniliophthora roreri MCA 2997]|uniref:Uncharacterized protein n=1 Tax=Moniliophthora roreri (strain MCA 2997) TaxID=1381753 RepID=V2X4A3_MONRO|nr:hypothetical protein Moror_5771 [Moniliophthora roreri MCA 2997]